MRGASSAGTRAHQPPTAWAARVNAIQEINPDILALHEVVTDESTTIRVLWERQRLTQEVDWLC